MIKISKYGDITRFDLSRSFFGRGLYWTTAYLIDGCMIDTGCAYTAPELHTFISDLQVTEIVNTHSHEDHIGANAILGEAHPGLKAYAHPLAIPVITNPSKNQPLHLYRKTVWGMPRPSDALPLKNNAMVETNKYRFQVIYTPGHTADHICLYEPDQEWVFTGDLFVGGKDRAIRAGSDIWGIIDSLKKIYLLPLKEMYPNSAQVRHEPGVALREKLDYLESTGGKVLELFNQGYGVDQISKELFGKAMWIELITMGHLSRRNLVKSYLNHPPR